MKKEILTAYFSASGVTKKAAKELATISESDLFEIKPKIPYTQADLNWMDKKSRSSIEMNDKTSRPEICMIPDNMDEYDTIFLCFPIWWYIAPTIINTFLESCELKNKTIVIFATSGGSGFGNTVKELKKSTDITTKIIEGRMLNGKTEERDIQKIVDSL